MLFRSYCTAAIAATLVSPLAKAASTGVEKNKSLRGGDYVAAVASADNHHHRVLQEEEEFTFLIADIQYENGVTASSRNRNLQGNIQGRGNGRGNNPNKPEHTINVQDAHGLIYEIEEGSGDTAGASSGAKVVLPSQAFRNTNGKINLGGGSLKLKTKKPKKNQKRDLQGDDSATDLRRHLAATGTKTVVAVRVVAANNAAYNHADEAGLSDDVFGTSGDVFNLKTGYEQCSHGQLTINPGGSDYGIVNGVVTITVDTAATSGNDAAMRNAVTAQINAQFGVSDPRDIADYWMYCLPPNVMNGIAYAFINSWQSVYSNEWCNYPSAQIHEVGHNFGYGHSNEGSTNYGDQSGMMGYSYSQDEGPVMCFNAAKSWQTGWFNNKRVNMNIGGSGATDNCLEAEITGQTDYDVNLDQTVLVKMNRNSGKDLFLMYNKKTAGGINSGTLEGGNTVMVVEAESEGTSYGESWLLGKLGAGDSKTFANYIGDGRDLVLSVLSFNDGKAQIRIDFDGLCDRTMAPTTSPCGNPSQKQVSVQITTDEYPGETSWTIRKVGNCAGQTDPNLSSPSYASKNAVQPIFEQCVDKGQYQFIINDAYGDGMCCGYGTGSFVVLYGDKNVFDGQSGDFGSSFEGTFGECEDTPATPPPTPNPTPFPTNLPTNIPTPNPTSVPTSPPTAPPTAHPTAPPTAPPTPVPTALPTAPQTVPPTPAPMAPVTPAPTNGDSPGPQGALFDSGYGVPRCANAGSSCDSLGLLNGRGTITNGAEPNFSNTNNNGAACADGNSGEYQNDESIEQITVTAGDIVSGTPVPSGDFIVEGGRAYVTVKVWCWGSGASDTADIYLSSDASSPDWQHLASITCPGGGEQTIRHAFDVPQGISQSIRVNFRYNGSQSTCSNGSYDDHDDLVFTVKESINLTPSPTPAPTLPPTPMPTNKAPSGPQTASYDGALGAPKCSVGSSCDSGALLNGRGSITNGVELNQPNTLNSCTDGNSGSFHNDESIDKIVVSRASGSIDDLTEGDVVTISATVWCWNTGSDDNIDFYYASDALNPVWTKIGERQQCPGGGIQTVTASYTLPQGAIQAVRANLMYGSNNPTSASCVTGSYDDTDDLVITVKPNLTSQGAAATFSPSKNDDVQGIIIDGGKDFEADKKKKELMDKNKSTSKPKLGKGGVSKSVGDKYVCSKARPFASTICTDGSSADEICSPENVGRICGTGGKKCWWAECN